MRTTRATLAVIALVATVACSSPAEETGSATTAAPGSSTTTVPGDGDGDRPGSGSGTDDPCLDPPDWALRAPADDHDCDAPPTTAPGPEPAPAPEPVPEPAPQPEPELGTGEVQITLRWTSAADLDLHVVEPDGTEISFLNPGPSASGGQLDVDSNVGCEPESSVENVFWPVGDMPLGSYRIEVRGYEVEGCGAGDYTVEATVKGESVLDEAGTVGQDEQHDFSFVAT